MQQQNQGVSYGVQHEALMPPLQPRLLFVCRLLKRLHSELAQWLASCAHELWVLHTAKTSSVHHNHKGGGAGPKHTHSQQQQQNQQHQNQQQKQQGQGHRSSSPHPTQQQPVSAGPGSAGRAGVGVGGKAGLSGLGRQIGAGVQGTGTQGEATTAVGQQQQLLPSFPELTVPGQVCVLFEVSVC